MSREAAEAIHADAVLLHRSELWFIIPTLILAVAAIAGVIVDPALFWPLGAGAAALMFRVGQWVVEEMRLRRTDPLNYVTHDFRDEAVDREASRSHESRRAATDLVTTPVLMAGIAVVTIIQFAIAGIPRSVELAGLVKEATRHGDWWRLLTASYLHGNLPHLLGNLSALFVLGGLVEMYDKRQRIPLVYLAGVLGGSLTSVVFVKGSAVGASAGILGLAGYLIVVFVRQRNALSGWLLTRLFAMLGSVAVTGLVGFMFIDNAAHAGGLAAGMLVGLFCAAYPVAPRTQLHTALVNAASLSAAAILVAGAFFTIRKLMS